MTHFHPSYPNFCGVLCLVFDEGLRGVVKNLPRKIFQWIFLSTAKYSCHLNDTLRVFFAAFFLSFSFSHSYSKWKYNIEKKWTQSFHWFFFLKYFSSILLPPLSPLPPLSHRQKNDFYRSFCRCECHRNKIIHQNKFLEKNWKWCWNFRYHH